MKIIKMKNITVKFIFFISALAALSSCKKFLDQSPDAVAFSEDEIFSDYSQSQKFIDQLLVPYTYLDDNDIMNQNDKPGFFGKYVYGLREKITDNIIPNQNYNWIAGNSARTGNFAAYAKPYWSEAAYDRFNTFWKGIRVCNLSIANIGKLQNATEEQKNRILGQAYFMRGHFYFVLLQGWGGMPMITSPLDPAQDMDLPRDSYTVTAQKIAATFDSAAMYLPLTIADADWGRPTKMAALAYKAKALLWAASPFSNPGGDQKLWQDAAVAAGEALKTAETSGYYHLVALDNWKKMFVDVNEEALHEVLFGRLFNNFKLYFAPYYAGIKSVDFGSGTFGDESVTENLAQSFTWSNGEPVDPNTTEYKTKPYYGNGTHNGRDPRFYESIIFNGADNSIVQKAGRKVEIWNTSYDNVGAKELQVSSGNPIGGYTVTGYYNWKLYADAFVNKGNVNLMWNYIRLADVYLFYAEAANRAWGPVGAPQGIPGFGLTAVDAINKIRERAHMPNYDNSQPWLTVGNTETFEKKIRNENRVETAFEEKRFYDIRRWRLMTDPDVTMMKGMYIKRTGPGTFEYTVVPLADNLNLKWQERHYLFPINPANTFLGPNFKQNPGW